MAQFLTLPSLPEGTSSVLSVSAQSAIKGLTLLELTKLVLVMVIFSSVLKCTSGGFWPVTKAVKSSMIDARCNCQSLAKEVNNAVMGMVEIVRLFRYSSVQPQPAVLDDVKVAGYVGKLVYLNPCRYPH